ncbi:RNA-guided endonuclease InsQ/TnpB family protein, partial [Alloscardovia criceti]|uniref:RNA-guided endonuclease InsQ/TnpB family protein n=1 Tax=Alloscardovia criceti TaxID=356828 RepID=UPI00037A5A13
MSESLVVRKVKLDPTASQEERLKSFCGASRFCFNAILAHTKDAYEQGEKINLTHYSLRAWWNRNKDRLAPWWSENSKEVYSNAALHVAQAYRNFFSGKGFPRFKKKGSKESFTIASGMYIKDRSHLHIPRIGKVHLLEPVDIEGRVTSITVSHKAGYWFASVLFHVDKDDTERFSVHDVIGVDLGIFHLMTLSTGEMIDNPLDIPRIRRKTQRLQRSVSKKKKGSKNRAKARERLARHLYRANRKKEAYLHEATTRIVRDNATIVLEDLNVSGMMKNHHLARSIGESNFFLIRQMITYKAHKYGRQVVLANRFYPSSKMCSGCKQVKAKLALSTRVFVCDNCGLAVDRDVNAAVNLKNLVAESTS